MPAPVIPGLILGKAVTDHILLAVAALEAELERQTSLREDLGRGIERARHDHEDAFERLLRRCRELEDVEVRRVEAARASEIRLAALDQDHRDALEGQHRESARAIADRLEEAEHRHHAAIAAREGALLRSHGLAIEELTRSHRAAAEAQALAIAEAEDRADSLRGQLARAETEFRKEAYRLSALIALRAQEAEAAGAEASALRERLAQVHASTSWKLARPLRILVYVLRRALRAPRRLARAVRSPR